MKMKHLHGYRSEVQRKNIAWFLPRPKKNKYRGGMPLYVEEWLLALADDILGYKGNPNVMPDESRLLNLFCGTNEYGYRVDINPSVKPDLICDIHKLNQYLDTSNQYEIILADPPYSNEESRLLYGTGKIDYKKWTNEIDVYLSDGGLLIVYHKYIVPNPNPLKYEVVKRVFVGSRINHTPRVAIFFQKKNKKNS